MEKYFVLWNRHDNPKQYIVAYIEHNNILWCFYYDKEQVSQAIQNGFRPFIEFPNINIKYYSATPFKTFDERMHGRYEKGAKKLAINPKAKVLTDNISIISRKQYNGDL